ncbi:MAG: hypothetical protein D6798_00065 [Deltaproteobacteria bacterium]|nr:MAG: hypothetical protein D6798_00065 [Deltaproteobacteria bacterium]
MPGASYRTDSVPPRSGGRDGDGEHPRRSVHPHRPSTGPRWRWAWGLVLLGLGVSPARGQPTGDADPLLSVLQAVDRGQRKGALPLPAVVIPVEGATGPPDRTCEEDLAAAAALRRTRPEPTPPAEPVRPPIDWPDRPQGERIDPGVMQKVTVTEATLADSGLPGLDPDGLPVTPLEGRPEDLARVGDVLRQAASGQRTRLTFFGASHTSGDMWTGHLRRILQERYGDLGHGFILPAALYRGYRGQDLNLCRTDGWRVDWVGRKDGRDDGLYGFGATVSSYDPADFGWLQTTTDNPQGRAVSRYEIFTLGEPHGGTLIAQVDEALPEALPTAASDVRYQRWRIEVPDGPHRLVLRPQGDGEVRILGVSAERVGPGVIVDAIGIRGRTARSWLRWDTDLATRLIASLDTDLIVLAYGTNEANDSALTLDDYRTDLRAVLDIARQAAPDAACILAGPSDRGKRLSSDTWAIWDRTAPIAQVQREVAPEFGCVFWDWQQATGGPGSQIAWVLSDPPLAARDGIHFTRAGYEKSAELFLMAMEQAALDSGGLPGETLIGAAR